MKTLNYHQTLEIVENFMIKTGIRNFCTNVCRGRCCALSCHNSAEACHKNEGRRLSCSAFVCYLSSEGKPTLYSLLNQGSHKIKEAINLAYVKGDVERDGITYDIYFKAPPPCLFTNFVIKSKHVTDCYVGLLDVTKKAVDAIMEYWNGLECVATKNKKMIDTRFSSFIRVDGKIINYSIERFRTQSTIIER